MIEKDAWDNLSRNCREDILDMAAKFARALVRGEAANTHGYGGNPDQLKDEAHEATNRLLSAIQSACKAAYGKKRGDK